MKKKYGRQTHFFILGVFLFSILLLSNPALADVTYKLQIPLPQFPNNTIDLCTGSDSLECSGIAKYIKVVYEWLIRFAIILGIGALTVAGLLWLTARGESKQVDTAKSMIKNTTWGIALALGSYVLLYALNPNLVDFGVLDLGKKIKEMKLEIENTPIDNPRSAEIENIVTKTPKKIVDRINMNMTLYKKIGAEMDVPWKLIAALHFQEDANNPATSMLNGESYCNNNDGSRCSACDNGETQENDMRCAVRTIRSKARQVGNFHANYSDRHTIFTLTATTNDYANPHGAMANVSMRYNGICPRETINALHCQDVTEDAYVMNNFSSQHLRMDFCAKKSKAEPIMGCKNWGAKDGTLAFIRRLDNPANYEGNDINGKLLKMD